MAKKHRTILLKNVNNTNITNHQGSFTLELDDFKKNLKVKVILDRWWLLYLIKHFWEVIDDEENELEKIRNAMRNGNNA